MDTEKKTDNVVGRHQLKTIDIFEYEKVNPKTQKKLKLINEEVMFMVVVFHDFLLSKGINKLKPD